MGGVEVRHQLGGSVLAPGLCDELSKLAGVDVGEPDEQAR
jgi:hypothetical protein